MERLDTPQDLERLRRDIQARRRSGRPVVSVCAGTGCLALGAQEVIAAFGQELGKSNLAGAVDCKGTGCPGFCERGPIVVVYPSRTCYLQVKPADVPEIVERTLQQNQTVERLLYRHPLDGRTAVREEDIPFYAHQQRWLLGNNMLIDSKSIDDYIALGGYGALAKALTEMTPQSIIEEVKKSGLRGRGGAGFPTGLKWEGSARAPDDIKYVIVNADEGDPGAFMDRALLEGNPHAVLEGLIIGAFAVGAREGYVYVRQEYPLAVENILLAIEQARRLGLLGRNILGSGFELEVFVHRGAGAFVSGESTALMTALEGRVGEPRPKYVRSNIKGLWNRPSVLNNVETWANIPLIIERGADWFASQGTAGSKGTKIFSLVGKINNTGLVEVPMGMSLRRIIFDIGGGIPGGKRFKAVQTGGPSGGCLPESLLNLPVGFDELTQAGSMMGSGGMIVMDEDTCMVDVARYFVDFLADESCGKCVPCREGLRQMSAIFVRLVKGEAQEEDLDTLQDLAEALRSASLCALGTSAANPFLSTLRYFREEYLEHIRHRRCPALVCKSLTAYWIDPGRCQACLICVKKCPVGAIEGGRDTIHVIDQEKCNRCGTCLDVCPGRFGAVKKVPAREVPPPIPVAQRALDRKSREK